MKVEKEEAEQRRRERRSQELKIWTGNFCSSKTSAQSTRLAAGDCEGGGSLRKRPPPAEEQPKGNNTSTHRDCVRPAGPLEKVSTM